MKIKDALNSEIQENPHNVKMSVLFKNNQNNIVHVTLEPGEKIKPHSAPATVLFYVLEGFGLVTIGSDKEEVSSNMLIECGPNIKHGWENRGYAKLRILVVKMFD
jgi:quercetin dioxygenase-like cupin family protein